MVRHKITFKEILSLPAFKVEAEGRRLVLLHNDRCYVYDSCYKWFFRVTYDMVYDAWLRMCKEEKNWSQLLKGCYLIPTRPGINKKMLKLLASEIGLPTPKIPSAV